MKPNLPSSAERTLFVDRINQAILEAQRNGKLVALLFIDVDRFKAINDSLGCSCGDAFLGTGFSSLSYLRRFPINRSKIDQSFVRDIEHTPANESITKAIIALAESLSLDIMVKGIEKLSEQMVLEKFGCTEGQGYLFAKPLSAAGGSDWMKQNNCPGAQQGPGRV